MQSDEANDDQEQEDVISSSDRSDFINMNIIENKAEMVEADNSNR